MNRPGLPARLVTGLLTVALIALPVQATAAEGLVARQAQSGSSTVNKTPTTIIASKLKLSGLRYDGIVDVSTVTGGVRAMKFRLTGLRLDNVTVSLPQEGSALRIAGRFADLDTAFGARSTMYVRQLKGKLKLGPIPVPVDFTPENPPPLTFPWLTFDNVTIGLYSLDGGELTVPNASLQTGVPHIALPPPTKTPVQLDGVVEAVSTVTVTDCAQVTGPVSQTATTVVEGIRVHGCIAGRLRSLLTKARADGVELGGGGWRSLASQIATRRTNCGTSEYAIYQMPASRCRPPTALPGTSMHERGLAVDFTHDGRIITSRTSPEFRWLAANAVEFGLKNLPGEPWHWSTNGR